MFKNILSARHFGGRFIGRDCSVICYCSAQQPSSNISSLNQVIVDVIVCAVMFVSPTWWCLRGGRQGDPWLEAVISEALLISKSF